MAQGLNTYVHVSDEFAVPHVFGPGDELPGWAVEKIGVHCFEDGVKLSSKPVPRKSTTKEASDG